MVSLATYAASSVSHANSTARAKVSLSSSSLKSIFRTATLPTEQIAEKLQVAASWRICAANS